MIEKILTRIIVLIAVLSLIIFVVTIVSDDSLYIYPDKMSMGDKLHQTLMDEGYVHAKQHFDTTQEMIKFYQNMPHDAKHQHRIITVQGKVEYISSKKVKDKIEQPVVALVSSKDVYVMCFIDNDSLLKVKEFEKGDHIFVLGIACDTRVKGKLTGVRLLHSMIDNNSPR